MYFSQTDEPVLVFITKASTFDELDYGNFSATVGQEEGIKFLQKFPKYSIGEKIICTTKRIAQKVIFKGDNYIVQ